MSTSISNTKIIHLKRADLFDEKSAIRFVWKCRIEYYARMLSWHESSYSYLRGVEGFSHREKFVQREINLIVFRFLRDVGIFVDDVQISTPFRRSVEIASKNFAADSRRDGPKDLGVDEAIALALLGHIDRISPDLGLPVILINWCSYLIKAFFQQSHAKAWSRIEANLR